MGTHAQQFGIGAAKPTGIQGQAASPRNPPKKLPFIANFMPRGFLGVRGRITAHLARAVGSAITKQERTHEQHTAHKTAPLGAKNEPQF